MRHNPASGAIVIMLRQLKMHGMAHAVGDLTEQGSPAFEAAIPILSQLLKAETAEREVRSTAYQLKTARFPAYRDLNGFDFAGSEINEPLVQQLHRCDFLDDANNIVLVGGPGTGKPQATIRALKQARLSYTGDRGSQVWIDVMRRIISKVVIEPSADGKSADLSIQATSPPSWQPRRRGGKPRGNCVSSIRRSSSAGGRPVSSSLCRRR